MHRQGRFRELAAEHPEIPQDRAGRERGQLDGVDRDDIPGLGAAHDDQPGYRRQRMPIASRRERCRYRSKYPRHRRRRRGPQRTAPHHTDQGKADARWRSCAHDSCRLHGSSDYINVVEQPARPSTRRSLFPRRVEACLQARLHDAGEPRGRRRALWARCLSQHPRLALVARSHRPARQLAFHDLLANWPYTIFMIMLTNRRLMDTPPAGTTAETRLMLERWGALHAGGSALGLVATLIFLWAHR